MIRQRTKKALFSPLYLSPVSSLHLHAFPEEATSQAVFLCVVDVFPWSHRNWQRVKRRWDGCAISLWRNGGEGFQHHWRKNVFSPFFFFFWASAAPLEEGLKARYPVIHQCITCVMLSSRMTMRMEGRIGGSGFSWMADPAVYSSYFGLGRGAKRRLIHWCHCLKKGRCEADGLLEGGS